LEAISSTRNVWLPHQTTPYERTNTYVALSADAVHSLTDLVSDFMTLATVSWALKPPTEKFPLGFGKVESLGSLGVSGLLLVGGFYMGWAAFLELLTEFYPAIVGTLQQWNMIGCGHSHDHSIHNIKAAWIAGGSVVVKEWLYRASRSNACYLLKSSNPII
jgi:divalent metal cation (Fe/Co/Zn/Cd) transporter